MALDGKLAILAAAVILPLAGGTPGQSITWGHPVRVAGNGNGNIQAVACPSTTDCIAMEPGGNIVTWSGTRWSRPGPGIKGASGIVSLSCPSATFCAAAGDKTGGSVWTGHGTTWTRNAPFGSEYVWGAVSCTSAQFCAALTIDGYVSTFNGRTWSTPLELDAGNPLGIFTLACAGPTRCFVMGSNDAVTELFEWDGSHWALVPFPYSLDKYASLGCAPTGFCMITDAGPVYASSSGSMWKKLPTAGPAGINGNLSCASASFCMLYDTTAHLYDGTGWRQFSTPPVTVPYASVACAGQMCAVVEGAPDSTANIYRSGRWGSETSIDNSGELDSVSCLPSGFCATAGMSRDAVVRQPGQEWGKAVQVSGGNGLSGVSCTSATFCLLVNGGGYSWRYNGTGWVKAPSLIDVSRFYASQAGVSCVSPGFCASAGAGLATFDGTRWTVPVETPARWTAVSCSSATFCAATDSNGDVSFFNGKSWSVAKQVTTGGWLSVDCLSARFCAISGSGNLATFNGTTWTVTKLGSLAVSTVTCTSASFCLAMSRIGYAFAFNGTQWSPAGSMPLRAGAIVESAACSTPTSCVAVDSLGDVTSGS